MPNHPVDVFFEDVVRSVHKRMEDATRRRLRDQQIFSIPETAELTGLSNPEVFQLIDDQEIYANEVRRGCWLIPREEVSRLVRRHAAERNCQAGLDFLAAADEDEGE